MPSHVSTSGVVESGPCPGHEYGSAAPAGVNISAPLSRWNLSGPAVASDNSVHPPQYTGTPPVPMLTTIVRVDKASKLQLRYDMRSNAANSRVVFSVYYLAADKTTLVKNTSNVTSNGNAPLSTALNAWESRTSDFMLGPNVEYARIDLSTNTSWNGPTDIRNLEAILTR